MDTAAERLNRGTRTGTLERRPAAAPAVEIVLPVHNEERVLAANVMKLHGFMCREFRFPFRITIADNASSDSTRLIAAELAWELDRVDALRLERAGRGNALRTAWLRSRADVVAYMDIDLSTDLGHMPALLLPLIEGTADVTIGSRLAPGAQVTRGPKRELISRSYNILLRMTLGIGSSDAQCGFKAARRKLVAPLLERVKDDGWFFDTELLYLAQQHKLSIREVPVRWVDDPDSRVRIVSTALEDLRGIRRLRRSRETDPARAAAERARAARWRIEPALPRARRGGSPASGRPRSKRQASFATRPNVTQSRFSTISFARDHCSGGTTR
jgi:glycosyltransferase involved in cell wall biosynthesis